MGGEEVQQQPRAKSLRSTTGGSTFDVPERYHYLKNLGSGSYGTVAAFHDSARQRDIAIKRIRHVFDSFLVVRRTLREIRLMRHFRHPNLLRLLKVLPLEQNGDLHMCLELMDCDLDTLVHAKHVKLSDRQCRRFCSQMLLGLLHLHGGNVIHRDLKPANIFVRLADCQVKIGDLGLSRGIVVNGETGEATHPNTENLTEYVVTRWYRAPEVLLNRSKYGPPVDVWSVGCILYEMWTSAALFPGKNSYDQLKRIVAMLGEPSPEELEWVPRESMSLLKRCCQPSGCAAATSRPLDASLAKAEVPLDGVALLHQLCLFDPSKRATVEQALQHEYLREWCTAQDRAIAKAIVPADVGYDSVYDGIPKAGEPEATQQLGCMLLREASRDQPQPSRAALQAQPQPSQPPELSSGASPRWRTPRRQAAAPPPAGHAVPSGSSYAASEASAGCLITAASSRREYHGEQRGERATASQAQEAMSARLQGLRADGRAAEAWGAPGHPVPAPSGGAEERRSSSAVGRAAVDQGRESAACSGARHEGRSASVPGSGAEGSHVAADAGAGLAQHRWARRSAEHHEDSQCSTREPSSASVPTSTSTCTAAVSARRQAADLPAPSLVGAAATPQQQQQPPGKCQLEKPLRSISPRQPGPAATTTAGGGAPTSLEQRLRLLASNTSSSGEASSRRMPWPVPTPQALSHAEEAQSGSEAALQARSSSKPHRAEAPLPHLLQRSHRDVPWDRHDGSAAGDALKPGTLSMQQHRGRMQGMSGSGGHAADLDVSASKARLANGPSARDSLRRQPQQPAPLHEEPQSGRGSEPQLPPPRREGLLTPPRAAGKAVEDVPGPAAGPHTTPRRPLSLYDGHEVFKRLAMTSRDSHGAKQENLVEDLGAPQRLPQSAVRPREPLQEPPRPRCRAPVFGAGGVGSLNTRSASPGPATALGSAQPSAPSYTNLRGQPQDAPAARVTSRSSTRCLGAEGCVGPSPQPFLTSQRKFLQDLADAEQHWRNLQSTFNEALGLGGAERGHHPSGNGGQQAAVAAASHGVNARRMVPVDARW